MTYYDCHFCFKVAVIGEFSPALDCTDIGEIYWLSIKC